MLFPALKCFLNSQFLSLQTSTFMSPEAMASVPPSTLNWEEKNDEPFVNAWKYRHLLDKSYGNNPTEILMTKRLRFTSTLFYSVSML